MMAACLLVPSPGDRTPAPSPPHSGTATGIFRLFTPTAFSPRRPALATMRSRSFPFTSSARSKRMNTARRLAGGSIGPSQAPCGGQTVLFTQNWTTLSQTSSSTATRQRCASRTRRATGRTEHRRRAGTYMPRSAASRATRKARSPSTGTGTRWRGVTSLCREPYIAQACTWAVRMMGSQRCPTQRLRRARPPLLRRPVC